MKNQKRRPMGRMCVCWIMCAGMTLLIAGCASDRQWGDTRPESGPDLENVFWGAAKLAAQCFASRQ